MTVSLKDRDLLLLYLMYFSDANSLSMKQIKKDFYDLQDGTIENKMSRFERDSLVKKEKVVLQGQYGRAVRLDSYGKKQLKNARSRLIKVCEEYGLKFYEPDGIKINEVDRRNLEHDLEVMNIIIDFIFRDNVIFSNMRTAKMIQKDYLRDLNNSNESKDNDSSRKIADFQAEFDIDYQSSSSKSDIEEQKEKKIAFEYENNLKQQYRYKNIFSRYSELKDKEKVNYIIYVVREKDSRMRSKIENAISDSKETYFKDNIFVVQKENMFSAAGRIRNLMGHRIWL